MSENIAEKAANKKRSALLKTGSSLMMKHGIERISVEEICREAGVSKMTFYKNFANKRALAEAVLSDLFQTIDAQIDAIRISDMPYPEKVKAFIRLKINQVSPLSWEFFKELRGGSNVEWRNEIKAWDEKNIRLFLDVLKDMHASGEIQTNVNPETIIYVIERVIEWMADERFVGRFVTIEALAAEIMNFIFYGFMGAREGKQP